MKLEELKEKSSYDYTLGKQIFCMIMVAVAALCLLFLLGAVALAVLMYID